MIATKKSSDYLVFRSGFQYRRRKIIGRNTRFYDKSKSRRVDIEALIFCIVEAKNGIIEEGYAQCAEEMCAAKLFNQKMGETRNPIYGAVTNAFDWVF